jgi:hypothetical protein
MKRGERIRRQERIEEEETNSNNNNKDRTNMCNLTLFFLGDIVLIEFSMRFWEL